MDKVEPKPILRTSYAAFSEVVRQERFKESFKYHSDE
jgi:hypothetical protein